MRSVHGRRLICYVLLLLSACSDGKDKGSGASPAALDREALLRGLPGAERPSQGPGAHAQPPSGKPGVQTPPPRAQLEAHAANASTVEAVFGERGRGVAQLVRKGDRAVVVHDGRPGRPYDEVRELVLSADGKRCAHAARSGESWRVVVDGKEGPTFDAVRQPVFSPDGAHVAYQGKRAGRWHLVVDGTANGGTQTRYLDHAFAGASRIVFVDAVDVSERGRLVVSDLAFRDEKVVDPAVSLFVVSPTRTRVAAVSSAGGQQRVVTFDPDRPEAAARSGAFDVVSDVVFAADGASAAFVGERSGGQVLVLGDKELTVGSAQLNQPPVVIPGGKGVGALVTSLSGAWLLREFFVEAGAREGAYDEAEGLVYSADGRHHAYAARRGETWFAVIDGKEGPPFERAVGLTFSPDGKQLAYRARQGGRRFPVVVETATGAVSVHPAYEQVFPVRFTPDGSAIAYGVKDASGFGWKTVAR